MCEKILGSCRQVEYRILRMCRFQNVSEKDISKSFLKSGFKNLHFTRFRKSSSTANFMSFSKVAFFININLICIYNDEYFKIYLLESSKCRLIVFGEVCARLFFLNKFETLDLLWTRL